jgi:hypothetical protein
MSERSLEPNASRSSPTEADVPRVDGGRIGIYAAIGGAVDAVPLPWVPAALVRRVRGALVHDVAARHGLVLANEARKVLAETSGPESPDGAMVRALRYASKRLALRALTRIGPLRALWPLRQALQVYALGALFDRYLRVHRGRATAPGSRLERDEAVRVRLAIDGAVARVLDAAPTQAEETPASAEVPDPRDRVTAIVDGLLGAAAGVPAHVMHRLDAAFDALVGASGER